MQQFSVESKKAQKNMYMAKNWKHFLLSPAVIAGVVIETKKNKI